MTIWPTLRISDVAAPEERSIAIGPFGSRMKADNYVPQGVPVVRGNNIVKTRSPSGEFVFITNELADSMPGCILREGDLVFPHRGAIGEVGLIRGDSSTKMILSTSLMKLRVDRASMEPEYVYYYFSSKSGRDQLLTRASTVGTPGIGQPLSSLRSIPIPVPPLPEQRAIAATLGALDDKIESNLRAIALTEDLVRARFDREFDLEQVTVGVSIADLVAVNVKRKLTRGTEATYVGMSSLPEFSPEILDWDTREFGSGQKFVNGDVLMARITPCLENGKTAVVDMLADGEIGWGSTEYVVLSPKGLISTPWIYALVRHELVREWAIRRMVGTSGRQRFQADNFGDYRIAEPDRESLHEFNSFAAPLFDRMTQLRDEMKRLITVRDALLPELLSGRIRVPVEEVMV